MARYYESETLIEFVKKYTPTINGETTMECVERAIREAPTADVVPKSEVEKLNKELDELAEEHSDLIVEKDQLFDIAEKQRVEIEALKIANEKMYSANKEQEAEIERLTINMNAYGLAAKRLAEEKAELAREIFAELETKAPWFCENQTAYEHFNEELAELKKKYTEEQV